MLVLLCNPSILNNRFGGFAGCVVAGRLANLDRNLTVLLIEGGENNLNNPWAYRYGICSLKASLTDETYAGYILEEHEAGLQVCLVLPFEAIQMACRTECYRALCQYPRRWLKH